MDPEREPPDLRVMTGVPSDGARWRVRARSGLILDISTQPDGRVLDEFFAGYDRAFVLPDEKEDLAGFRACLELGHGSERERLVSIHGPHVEIVAVARVTADGPVIGGGNFIAYPISTLGGGEKLVAGNLNYVFVVPEARGRGVFRKLVDAMEELMAALFAPPWRRAMAFIELNDPLVLSDEAYRLDSETAGVDQFDRLAIWSRLGARVIDFPYVQPPLSARQQADGGLIYAVLGMTGEAWLEARVLLAHLERFFGVSVLKGVDPWTVPVAAEQLEVLRGKALRGERVPLIDPAPAIEAGRRLRAAGGERPDSFRAFARSLS